MTNKKPYLLSKAEQRHIMNVIDFLRYLTKDDNSDLALDFLKSEVNIKQLEALKNWLTEGLEHINYLLELNKIPKIKSY